MLKADLMHLYQGLCSWELTIIGRDYECVSLRLKLLEILRNFLYRYNLCQINKNIVRHLILKLRVLHSNQIIGHTKDYNQIVGHLKLY